MKRARFLILSLALVASGVACGGGSEPDVVAYFEDAGDLVTAAEVQVNDVKVGSVSEIQAIRRGSQMVARVEMDLAEDSEIPAEGLQAVVRQTSLLGEQFIQLVPTSDAAPFAGDVLVTIELADTDRRVDIETFLADLSGFIGGGGLEDLNRFTHAQALILEGRGERFGRSITELRKFTGVLADRKSDISSAIDHLASAGTELAANLGTLGRFFDSLEDANVVLADQSEEFGALLRSFRRFGAVNARFLARHEEAIDRSFRSLAPILRGLAGAQRELRADITGLKTFFTLFPRSIGGGPGGDGDGDYIQADAIVCEVFSACSAGGSKGDVPGEGS